MSFLKCDVADLLRTLERDEQALVGAARPAAQAAAQVVYDCVQGNVAALGRVTGKLADSIYQVYSGDNSGPGHAVYHVSYNHRKAPHGFLVEYGHVQRYVTYIGSNGRFYTAIRPEMRGKPSPKRSASAAAKDAYYIPLAAPKQVPAKPFIRSATRVFPQAVEAAREAIMKVLDEP